MRVTADDYGLHRAVNAAIHRLARLRAIDAVSVMMHPEAVLEDVRELVGTQVELGLHLVLIEEKPLRPELLQGLLDGAGRLPGSWRALFMKVSLRPRLLDGLRQEMIAQIERYRSFGLPLCFINSHQHVHAFPLIWRAFCGAVASVPGVGIRSAHEQRLYRTRQAMLALASKASWALVPAVDRPWTSPMGIDDAGHMSLPVLEAAARSCERLLLKGARGLPELVVHPGDEDSSLRRRYGHWNYEWGLETAALASESWRRTRGRLVKGDR